MFRILLYFAAIIGLSWAGVPYGDIKSKVFAPESTDFEKDLFKAMEVNKQFLPDDDIGGAAAETVMNVLESLPVIGDASGLLLSFSSMLEEESDWKKTFTRAIADGSDRKTLEQEIVKMQARIESIQKSLMNDKNLDLNTIAWSTRKDLDYMMNIFAAHKSLFKRYALIGAPVVIQLAELIASLNSNINNHDISCTMRNILLEYRKRSVDARMDEITTEWTSRRGYHDQVQGKNYDLALIRSRVMSLNYNKNGYNSTNELPCQKYSKSSSVPASTYAVNDKFNDDFYYGVFQPAYQKYDKVHNFPDNMVAKEFNKFDVGYNSLTPELKCAVDYYGLIRHRVEQLFPVELFNAYCGAEDSQVPTGRGYLTIKFKHGSFVVENDGLMPEYDGDEPYVDVYIKKKGAPSFELKWTSSSLRECFQCDFDRAFESDKIDKDSVVMIEVWDEDRGRKAAFNPDDKLISGTDATRTVTDLLKNGMFFLRNHQDKKTELFNYIETVAFWKDEYKLPPIADLFLKKNPKSN